MLRLPALAAIALTALAAASPAVAVTYDAFTSFDGSTNPVNNFSFGVFDGTAFTPYVSNTGCTALISDTVCLNTNGLPGAFKTTSGAHTSGTVLVPGDALIFHPGPIAGQSAAVLFTAPTSQFYHLSGTAFVADTNPSGTNIGIIIDRGRGVFSQFVGSLSASSPTLSATYDTYLVAGQSIGGFVDFAGSYNNDSTGVRFRVTELGQTLVPEPAALALFGMGALALGLGRRRR